VSIARILSQTRIPVVIRRRRGRIQLRLPYSPDNRVWIWQTGGQKPQWIKGKPYSYWSLPAAWFNRLCLRLIKRYGRAYVIQPHNENAKCAPACWDAEGLDCECSCLGENHGNGEPDGRWYVIDETCAFSWQGESWRWSLLRPRQPPVTAALAGGTSP
jgi:hypothetical protein